MNWQTILVCEFTHICHPYSKDAVAPSSSVYLLMKRWVPACHLFWKLQPSVSLAADLIMFNISQNGWAELQSTLFMILFSCIFNILDNLYEGIREKTYCTFSKIVQLSIKTQMTFCFIKYMVRKGNILLVDEQ